MGDSLDKTCHSFPLTTGICTPLHQPSRTACRFSNVQVFSGLNALACTVLCGIPLAPPPQLKGHLHTFIEHAVCQ